MSALQALQGQLRDQAKQAKLEHKLHPFIVLIEALPVSGWAPCHKREIKPFSRAANVVRAKTGRSFFLKQQEDKNYALLRVL